MAVGKEVGGLLRTPGGHNGFDIGRLSSKGRRSISTRKRAERGKFSGPALLRVCLGCETLNLKRKELEGKKKCVDGAFN